jgi:D-amino peptidase
MDRSAARTILTRLALITAALAGLFVASPGAAQQRPLRVFISVDMEGIAGIGTPAMTSSSGKDYATGRRLATDEVNAVIRGIFAHGPADIVVNDSHGDHQNLLHTELDPRVVYIQGSIKPLGMVAGLDSTFDAAIFVGYHARAGTAGGFLAHTGSGAVKGLWINDIEVGEGGMNAAFAGSMNVPVILASGDSVFTEQFASLLPTRTVSTKVALTPSAARLVHPTVIHERLAAAATEALADLPAARAWRVGSPVRVRLRLADVTTPQILEAVPGVRQVDGFTVEFTASTMDEAYRLIRLMYRFVSL